MLSDISKKRIIFNKTSVVDPDSMNPDPAFQVNTDPDTDPHMYPVKDPGV
jgi:hypothetical protein